MTYLIPLMHKYLFQLDVNRNVIDMHCTCVARSLKRCKHIYALVYFIDNHRSMSKPSYEQAWGKPSISQMSKALYAKGMSCAQLFPPKTDFNLHKEDAHIFTMDDLKDINCAAKEIVILENRNKEEIERRSALRKLNKERIIIEEGARIEACCKFFIQCFCQSELYGQAFCIKNNQHKVFFEKHVALNDRQIITTCIKTKSQSNCVKWDECRKMRITASEKAHRIKQMRKKTGA
jgi:hypothetical protein